MEPRRCNALTIVFAGAGFFWLLWLAMGDYLTRQPIFLPAALASPSP
jgi:hypothetical protein